MKTFIQNLPKAELHLHIEGTLEPELMFKLATKNGVDIPYKSVEEVRKAYEFDSLDSFLKLYYAGANVLIEEEDFFELTWEYFLTCKQQNIVHTEIMFDPQTHTKRGIKFETVINGISKAQKKAEEELGISSFLIMCFLRDLSQEDAFRTYYDALPFREKILAIGLDSSELGNPPRKFMDIFNKANKDGFKLCAHAGEEADSSYIKEAYELLHVDRVDHGIACEEDEFLMQELIEAKIPLTVCPLSNVKLKAVENMKKHNIIKLLEKGLLVTVNSDDPSYFGGYLNENYEALVENLDVSKEKIKELIRNSFRASFLSEEKKREFIDAI